jgi:DNA primase
MNILDAVSSAGVPLKKAASTKGGEYAGPCPGCGGKDRFRCWPAEKGGEGSYWCRGCNSGGDLVQFLKDYCGYSYPDAFAAAGRSRPEDYKAVRFRPAVNKQSNVSGFEEFNPKVYETPVETWQVKAGEFVDKAHQALLSYDKAMEYLNSRGLDEKAVKGFRLGWFAGEKGKNCAFRPRTSWGLSQIKNHKTGRDKMLWLPRGIIIPCFKNNRVYRIRIRRPKADIKTEHDVKYYVLPGSGMEVMDYNADKKSIVIVEAELDAMLIARHAGSITGVVSLGSAMNKPGSSVFYNLKKTLRILVALDYDQAGQKAWVWWSQNFKNAKLWPVPDGKDPGEAFEKGINIKEWIKAGLPPAVTMESSTLPGYKIPRGVYPMQELRMLLQKYPVTIQAEKQKAKIMFDPGFKNQAIRQRVNDIFFGDDEVHWYLRMYHPDNVITSKNCEVQKI